MRVRNALRAFCDWTELYKSMSNVLIWAVGSFAVNNRSITFITLTANTHNPYAKKCWITTIHPVYNGAFFIKCYHSYLEMFNNGWPFHRPLTAMFSNVSVACLAFYNTECYKYYLYDGKQVYDTEQSRCAEFQRNIRCHLVAVLFSSCTC